jgi:hypothetical protein
MEMTIREKYGDPGLPRIQMYGAARQMPTKTARDL